MKHILVSITYRDVLHWRLIAAHRVDRHWEISSAAYSAFLRDIGYAYNPEDGRSSNRTGNGPGRITLG